ncbi:MAG: hypothetical protein C0514_03455 [Candidatus Puniceispirillum sp.]|nr:hypothetical protein [Candidatus Puniceispirillum sp.]
MTMIRFAARIALTYALFIQGTFAKDLTIYIRDSFYEKWEAPLQKAYEERGKIRFIRLSGTALTTRLRLEGWDTKADVVLGAESVFMPQFQEMGCVGPLKHPPAFDVPFSLDPDCVPFSYGYLGLLYNEDLTGKTPLPRTWQDLVHLPQGSLLCANPQTSSTGLMFWAVLEREGLEEASRPVLRALPKGLAQTYGLFAAGKAPFVVGFTTSSAHRTGTFATAPVKPLIFDAHPALAYVAFLTPRAKESDDAQFFLSCLVGGRVQAQVFEKDHLYPVLKPLRENVPFAEPKAISMSFSHKEQRRILQRFFASFS